MLQAEKAVSIERAASPVRRRAVSDVRAVTGARPRSTFPGRKVLSAFILAGCFVLGLVVIIQYSSIVKLHFQLNRADTRLAGLKEEYRALELEAARLGSLSRIEFVARSELGMMEPDSSQLRFLTAGQQEGR